MIREKKLDVRKLTIIGVLGAISIVLGSTPLGFIPVGPTSATIMHIPVIIGSIMEGPVVGAFIGLIFGLFSAFRALTNPTPVSFIFLNPLISIVPRVLIGIITYYVYNGLKKLGNQKTIGVMCVILLGIVAYLSYGIYDNIKAAGSIWLTLMNIFLVLLTVSTGYFAYTKFKDNALDVIVSTIVGSLTNTIGVLGLVYLIYAEKFVKGLGGDVTTARKVIFGIGVANGIPETIIAIIIVTSVVVGLENRR